MGIVIWFRRISTWYVHWDIQLAALVKVGRSHEALAINLGEGEYIYIWYDFGKPCTLPNSLYSLALNYH